MSKLLLIFILTLTSLSFAGDKFLDCNTSVEIVSMGESDEEVKIKESFQIDLANSGEPQLFEAGTFKGKTIHITVTVSDYNGYDGSKAAENKGKYVDLSIIRDTQFDGKGGWSGEAVTGVNSVFLNDSEYFETTVSFGNVYDTARTDFKFGHMKIACTRNI